MSEALERWRRFRVYALAVGAGAGLGCIFRSLFSASPSHNNFNPYLSYVVLIMTVTFLAVVPMAMGYLSVGEYLRAAPAESVRVYKWIFLPWISVILSMGVAVLFKWEGIACIVFAGPLMLLFSLVGGICAWLAWRRFGQISQSRLSAFAVPLALLMIEAHIPNPQEIRTVQTEILIHAPANVVWNNIKSVRRIEQEELPRTWVQGIGFPSPIAATLSHEGVGGVRAASFSGGLVFTETVNKWEPEDDLRFSIHSNTDSIPRSTLDEHVTIGGAFFDVLDGEYQLEQRPDGVLLHLKSRERLSTHFNPYAGQWTDAVMRAIQEQILAVIRRRCKVDASVNKVYEKAPSPAP